MIADNVVELLPLSSVFVRSARIHSTAVLRGLVNLLQIIIAVIGDGCHELLQLRRGPLLARDSIALSAPEMSVQDFTQRRLAIAFESTARLFLSWHG